MKLPSLRAVFILLLVCSAAARAAIVYSGSKDIPIPLTFDGIYLDLDNGATGTAAFAGWDANVFFGGVGFANSPDFQPARTGTGSLDAIIELLLGDPVDGTLFYGGGYGGSGNPNAHLGPGTRQFLPDTDGFLGFKWMTNQGAGPFYGWMRVKFTNNTGAPLIRDWAYENSGASIKTAETPEPGSGALMFGALLFARRWRYTGAKTSRR